MQKIFISDSKSGVAESSSLRKKALYLIICTLFFSLLYFISSDPYWVLVFVTVFVYAYFNIDITILAVIAGFNFIFAVAAKYIWSVTASIDLVNISFVLIVAIFFLQLSKLLLEKFQRKTSSYKS